MEDYRKMNNQDLNRAVLKAVETQVEKEEFIRSCASFIVEIPSAHEWSGCVTIRPTVCCPIRSRIADCDHDEGSDSDRLKIVVA